MLRKPRCSAIGISPVLLLGIMFGSSAGVGVEPSSDGTDATVSAKLHPALFARLAEEPGPVKTWVFFTDKGIRSEAEYTAAIERVASTYNRRAIQRRMLRSTSAARGGPVFGEHDLPVVQSYIDAVVATGARRHVTSRWVNAISVYADRKQLEEIAALPFVKKLQPVARAARIDPPVPEGPVEEPPAPPKAGSPSRVDYGASYAQLDQMNLIALHEEGYTGQGVIIGMLDSGFKLTHEAYNDPANPLNVIAAYDFINLDDNVGPEPEDPYDQHDHGTKTLSCIGAYKPGSLVGGAYDASFILAKTEDTSDEYPAEEDNYVAGLEFIESNGADMESSSLGYIDWYTQDDLDGQTAVTTIAVNVSTSLGVHHCNSAGNEYHDSDPSTSSLIAPSDGFDVITCGAVDSSGGIVYFSSDGPTADGRVKPELLALGSGAAVISSSSDTGYTSASGTSFSAPLIAAAVGCLIQAKPYWTVQQMREHLFETADYYVTHGTHDPLYVRGYGIINAFAAYDTCSDAGVVTLDRDKYACESTASIMINDCGLNTDDETVEYVTVDIDSDSETGVEQVTLTETDPGSAEFLGTIDLSTTNAPGTLLVAENDTVTVTYIDADDGQGGTNITVTDTAAVDCTAPGISNVQTSDVEPRSALVSFTADEPVRGTVYFGQACDALTETVVGSSYTTAPEMALTGLVDDTTYFYTVEAADEAGNTSADDNSGDCYSFATPQIPDFFTELFGSDNDLGNLSLTFEPNASNDFYAGCVEEITELPVDPSGGTALTFSPSSDDGYALVNLSGATVAIYGTVYDSFYVGSNGYVTFGGGDTEYSESLEDHFSMPRFSVLFDDFNPGSAGTVSWKQLADRAVVTWDDVPEWNTSNSSTFQIEMHFDGTIVMSYLAIAASDGLAGLSAGDGVDPDFYETDLSGMGTCGPRPPTAEDTEVNTPVEIPVTIVLEGTDDGLPDPPAALDYIITSLPTHGTLTDIGAGLIETLPYTLVGGGNQVEYAPGSWFAGEDSFQFKVNDGGTPPEGGDSDLATVSLTVGGHSPVYAFPLDSDPGWSCEGQWQFGKPQGNGSFGGDPLFGYTGSFVYGYNLDGDYDNDLTAAYLTTPAFNCSSLTDTELRFRRWLGVDSASYDHASVEVSNNGSTWTTVWDHTGGSISETSWSLHVYDISAVADGQSQVYIRWAMGPTNGYTTYPGWNLDDLEIRAIQPLTDCNDNEVPDNVDIAEGTSEDCNSNLYPDECDLAEGTSADCNENGVPDECDVAEGTSPDVNGNSVPDECEPPPAAAADPPHDVLKNRYVSFVPNNGAFTVAYQVELTDSLYFPDSPGVLGWVGEAGANDVARVVPDPFFSNAWPEVLHLGDCGIVPVATYAIRSSVDGMILSDPLAVATVAQPTPKKWGDVVGEFVGEAWTGPNGEVNMDDVMAAVQRFQQLDGAPPLLYVDVDGETPNLTLNFTDILRIVQGFKGEDYPFSAPADCP